MVLNLGVFSPPDVETAHGKTTTKPTGWELELPSDSRIYVGSKD